MNKKFFWTTPQYIKYKLVAKHRKGHGIHSPLIFDFVLNVLNQNSNNQCFKDNKLKEKLLKKNKTKIIIQDLGQGSSINNNNIRSISNIAKYSTTPFKYRSLIGKTIQYYNLKKIIELGTSTGLTADLIASCSPTAELITVEGSTEIYKVAKQNITNWKHKNITIINTNFRQFIQQLKPLQEPSLVYIDGHHNGDATLEYFNAFWNKIQYNSIIVIGDIYWSKAMTDAWKKISVNTENQYSLDLFHIGIIFKHNNCSGNKFVIKY